MAGRVESVGANVKLFHPGDQVYGVSIFGAFAEYVCVKEKYLAMKPANVSFEEAATIPIAATTALDAIAPDGREKALTCGANVIMVNLTPSPYRRLYDIYPKKGQPNSVRSVKEILARLGRPTGNGYGHSLKWPKKEAFEEWTGYQAGLGGRF